MARKGDASFSPFLQTVKTEQSEYDEDKAESAFFGMVDNEDEDQRNQSAVLSPNSLVNMALSLELEDVDKSTKRAKKVIKCICRCTYHHIGRIIL
uniref:Uncharacterized protein n=1 Tax=Ditylenchus dipsaci TaxID=166011 RepID=A0A915E6N6_9BILA